MPIHLKTSTIFLISKTRMTSWFSFSAVQEIKNGNTAEELGKFHFSKPSMLIASTRSHSELRNLQQHNFDSAAFTSEKTEVIKQKLINTINKKTTG